MTTEPATNGLWRGPRSMHGGVDEVPLPGGTGRLWLAGKHYVGPDPEAALAATGAGLIVCLNEVHELADRYAPYVAWLHTNDGDRAIWWPVPDLHAPSESDATQLLASLASQVRSGAGLLVHCGAGIGRAGTVAVGLLLQLGVDLEGALATVAAHRPTAGPEAGTQRELLESLAARRS